MTEIDIDSLLAELKSKSTARKSKSLDIVNAVLKKQTETGELDFSISNIGRHSHAAGGPTTQSIRNAGGADYRRLIDAWADVAKKSAPSKPKAVDTHRPAARDKELLDRIADPALRGVVGSIIAERNRYRSELRLLKSQTELVVDRRPAKGKSISSPIPTPSLEGLLSPIEKEALCDAVSLEFLDSRGWSETKNGRIKDDSGRALYKPGYTSGIRKLLEVLNH